MSGLDNRVEDVVFNRLTYVLLACTSGWALVTFSYLIEVYKQLTYLGII